MAIVAFLGLGTMGYPMAAHLAQAGHSLKVYNRTTAKAKSWAENHTGHCCLSPSEAIQGADYVLSCLGRDSDLEEVLIQSKALAKLKPGALLIDHTTTSASLAENLASRVRQQHARFADAPVSGGQQGAQQGLLSIMVGCQENDFAEIKALLTPYTKAIARMGEVGFGQKTKMVNQICVAGLIQALAEGIQFAQKAGLDVTQVMNLVGAGAASSWQLLNRHQTMIAGQYQHGFAIDWMYKDLQICLQEAKLNGASLPVTALVTQFYQELQQQGLGKLDTSALLLRLNNHSELS